jgi:hypothetical protein
MRKGILAAVLSLLACTGASFAQSGLLAPVVPPLATDAPPVISDGALSGTTLHGPRGWVGFDYLNWWITPGPIGVPLVTTGNPASPTAGAIGDPSTVVLFGNGGVNFGPLQGGRLSGGYWLDCDATCGVEASAFWLALQRNSFSASSDAAGNPLLALPFFTPGGAPGRTLISSPAIPQTGSVTVTTSTQLWGADINAVWNCYRDCTCSIDLLAGFRYYNLAETLELGANSAADPPATRIPFNADFFFTSRITTLTSGFDLFSTRNQFYGGQIGARAAWHDGRCSAEILGMLAMGGTERSLYANGAAITSTTTTFSQFTTAGVLRKSVTSTTSGATVGGFYTNPNNIGTFDNCGFSVVPQIELKLGYDLTSRLRATIGYDAMFWTNVERPGNQISNVQGAGPLSNGSNVWVQGFSVGLEYRW